MRSAGCRRASIYKEERQESTIRPLTLRTLTRKIGPFVREDSRHPGLKPFVDLVLEKTG